jgi:molybdopterin converting factor small subunit
MAPDGNAGDDVKLRVRLFGALAEDAGARAVEVAVDPPAAAGEVVAAVRSALPALARLVDRSQLAVYLEVARAATPVHAGDEVTLLPQVAGGAGGRRHARNPHGHLPVEDAVASVGDPAAGATVVFLGTVRDHSEAFATVDRLEYAPTTR